MAVTRVTQNSIANITLRGLQGSLDQLQRLQSQLSSGKAINVASDDPAGTDVAMSLGVAKSADDQYLRNLTYATGRLNTADSAMQELSKQLQAARNAALQSRNGALGPTSQSALSDQMLQIRGEAIDQYNATYADRPVFAGTAVVTQAVDSATGTYQGDNVPISTRISASATVRVDVPGTTIGADTVPALLARVAGHMTGSGVTSQDLSDIDAELAKVSTALGDVGGRQARVDGTKDLIAADQNNLSDQISANVEIDLPSTIMHVQTQQVAYQAALGAASKLLQKSLVDFLA